MLNYILKELSKVSGHKLLVSARPELRGRAQFSIVGPRGGLQGTTFVKAKTLRELGRELIRYANEMEGKENLKVVNGG